MGGYGDRYKDIDANIAANVRAYREAAGMSQEELAQQMADRGFPFTQATVWKVERGQRPVRAGELIALGDIFGRILVTNLTNPPDATRHTIQLERTSRNASAAYSALKAAAAAYLDAQVQLAYAARLAHDAGHGVSELYTSWLDTPAEEAVIEARVEYATEDERHEQLHGEVTKILDALRDNGYEPALRIEDITISGGEPGPGETPAPPADTAGGEAEDPERQA
jgi:transcriptional regulator with XRE-family HTH domain